MKKSLFALAFAGLGVAASASNTLFDVDYNEVTNALTEVVELEQFVIENEGVTYAELAENNSILITNITDGTQLSAGLQDGPIGIPSFIWGCVLGVIGILIVYLIEKDSDETKKSLYGCLVGYALGAILWFAFVGAMFSTAATVGGI